MNLYKKGDDKNKFKNINYDDSADQIEKLAFDFQIYQRSLDELILSFKGTDVVEVYQKLHQFWGKFINYVDKFTIEQLKIPEIIQLLLIQLSLNTTTTNFNQIFIKDIFHTFNLIIQTKNLLNPYQYFKQSNLLQILLVIPGLANNDLFLEIIKFLRLVFDATPECQFFEYSIIQTSTFYEIGNDYTKYSQETFLEFVSLIDQLAKYPNEQIANSYEIYFLYSLFFINIGNIQAIASGFEIIHKLLNQDNEKIKELVSNSNEFSSSVLRLLHPETDKSILLSMIVVLGIMCAFKCNMQLFQLTDLIQFLSYNDDHIKMCTSFALCNALNSNSSQFSVDDVMEIINLLNIMMEEDSFNVKMYVGEIILKIFSLVPKNRYVFLIQKGFFNILFRIFSIDSLFISHTELMFQTLSLIFMFAEENNLWPAFAQLFEESGCYSTVTSYNLEDNNQKVNFDSFLSHYEEKKSCIEVQ